MTKKPAKPATPTPPKPRKYIPAKCPKDDTPQAWGEVFAEALTAPETAAHRVIQAASPPNLRDEIDVPGMLAVLRQQAAAVNRGDMAQAEAMLMNQATALQSLFTHLTERGLGQSLMPNLEGFMRLALRAQSQCRATLETLATIKNPPIVYARQANVTTGPQQINNGTPPQSQAQGIENEQTKQSGPELLPDARASGNASRVNPALEALGEVDRAKVARG